jgi:hypothetical protein
MPDETCRAFDSVAAFDRNALHRFIVGADPAPRKMTTVEVNALGDPFASLLFARGKIPRSGEDVVDKIKTAVPTGNPLKRHSSFILGEGSQLPSTPQTADVGRSLRFVVTLGAGPEGPDLFVSVVNPRQAGGVEVMAWDRKAGGFNYYRSTGNAMWMFGGNSRDALRDSSRGKGPFESHRSGALLMKELKSPWINWHSPDANIPETAFRPTDPRRTHKWFTEKEPGGGLTLETEAARPAITRWAKERFKKLRKDGGPVTRPRMIMEQILDTPTVNIATTHNESGALQPADQLDLPATFFVDSEGLADTLGLTPPPFFTVSGRIYAKCLDKFDVRLEEGLFAQMGDSHFCFLVLERGFEDQVVLRQAIEIGLVTKRLAASLLMVDPWNPIFSDRRRALLNHVPATASIEDGKSSFSSDMARAILKAAKAGPAGTPEAEFAERWKVGANFKGPFGRILNRYYKAVTAKLATQAGFEGYFKLNEERRQTFKATMPIAEFPLLLPHTNITATGRQMARDGTVAGG